MNRKTDREMALGLLSELIKFIFSGKRARKNRVEMYRYLDKYKFKFSEILMKKFMCKTSFMIVQKFLKSPEPIKTWFITDLKNRTFWDIQDVEIEYHKDTKMYTVDVKINPQFWNINFVITKLVDLFDDVTSHSEIKRIKCITDADGRHGYEVNIPYHIVKKYFDKTELDILTTQDWLYKETENRYKLERFLGSSFEHVSVKIVIKPMSHSKSFRFKFVK